MEIKKDYTRDELFDDYGLKILKDRYLTADEKSPQDAFERVVTTFCDDEEHAQRMYDYVSKHWCMFASPVLSNGGTTRGLPISCFLNYVPDSRRGLSDHHDENVWLSSMGGGVGGYWGHIRSDGSSTSHGSRSTGSIPFMHVVDSQMLAYSQGTNRRGAYAAYMDISHPEVEEFITMRKPGGDINRKNFNMHHGVNIPDEFMELVESKIHDPDFDDSWNLVDPNSKAVVKTVSAIDLWEAILTTRHATGEPYLHFIDKSRKGINPAHKELGLNIFQSNLCTEIILPTNEKRTAVCCLSSVNLEYYDEWKNTGMVRDMVRFLDNVLDYFINKAPEGMEKAAYSAYRERSIGLGAMGFHAYLQKNMIPFESIKAVETNSEMFSHIWHQALKESYTLGEERGFAPDYIESGVDHQRRNCYLLAVAPNASSSIICGNTSPSVEPFSKCGFSQKTHNGTNIYKNKYLDKILKERLYETYGFPADAKRDQLWKQIIANGGSCSNIDILSEEEKQVFKTADEIDQNWIVNLASDRQKFIDQAQSINLFFSSTVNKTVFHNAHFNAWKKGLKTLYYCRTHVGNRTEDITQKFDRKIIDIPLTNPPRNDSISCVGCEG